jgi:hypothetical protein
MWFRNRLVKPLVERPLHHLRPAPRRLSTRRAVPRGLALSARAERLRATHAWLLGGPDPWP